MPDFSTAADVAATLREWADSIDPPPVSPPMSFTLRITGDGMVTHCFTVREGERTVITGEFVAGMVQQHHWAMEVIPCQR